MAQSFKKGVVKYGTRGFRAPEFTLHRDDSSDPLEAPLVNELAVAADLWAAGATALCFAAGVQLLVPRGDGPFQTYERQKKQDADLCEGAKAACYGSNKANWTHTRAILVAICKQPIVEAAVYECCSALLHYEAARR
eukprot:2527134-Rhodomonas_salina.1